MPFEKANRLRQLPPYLFQEIDRLKKEVAAQGVDIINLGIGDPDMPTPDFIVTEMLKATSLPTHHQYPDTNGMLSFRTSVAQWCQKRFGLDLDPAREVISLIGSKEAIGHFPLAYINEGDIVLVPTPGYPVYHAGTLFAGGTTYEMPLLKENNFLPDLEAIPDEIAQKAKIMWLNYPNNPTGAVADKAFFEKVVTFAKKHNILVAHDAAYSEMGYEGYQPISFLETEGARDIGIEFHSLSKSFNMTGWRIGFAIGNAEIIAALAQIKSNLDSGVFGAIQDAAIAALTSDQKCVAQMQKIYQERRDTLVTGLRELGLDVNPPKASFYVWCSTPKGMKSSSFSSLLLKEAGIVATPGNGFGAAGEGYIRFALTVSTERLKEALERMRKLAF